MTRRLRHNALITTASRIDLLKHLSQLVAKVFHILEAISWLLGECFVDDLLQARWNLTRAQLRNRSRCVVQNCVAHINSRLAAKRPRAGQHFVKQNAEREDISAFIDTIATRLFRGVDFPVESD